MKDFCTDKTAEKIALRRALISSLLHAYSFEDWEHWIPEIAIKYGCS
jgi:hypothetical protein